MRNQPLIIDYDITDIEMQFHHVDFEWSGDQPSFLQQSGFIRMNNTTVNWIEIAPDVTLGEIIATFGEPDHISGNDLNLIMRYIDAGFHLRFQPDCDNFFASRSIIYYDTLPTSLADESLSLEAAFRLSCQPRFP
ncbi:MAG: hypothetical protein Q9P01_04080 [Anaerolineae bacterium]|nr:hypothetical protein [Anaerolineae bacterium]